MKIADILNYLLQQQVPVDYSLRFSLVTIIDIGLVLFILGAFLYKFRRSPILNILIGLSILVGLSFASSVLNLHLTHLLINFVLFFILVSLPVMFQQEIRTYLYKLGALGHKRAIRVFSSSSADFIDEIIEAVIFLAEHKIGALIVIAQTDALDKYVKTGYRVNAPVSAPLLKVIFNKDSMLHDGAVIIRDGEIVAAGCVLPNSKDDSLNGMRHRAGLGITEVSDALAIVVSEESGQISLAEKGKMLRHVGFAELPQLLDDMMRIK